MSDTTAIEWCDSTFNPWIGCTRVSPACDDCYAARSTPARTLGVQWGAGQPRHRTALATWRKPLQWNDSARCFRECRECGWRGVAKLDAPRGWLQCGNCLKSDTLKPARRRVFCASLADVFDTEVPRDWRTDLFATINATPQLHWLLLTKRIGNVTPILRSYDLQAMPPNVWLGITVVDHDEAARDVPKLLAVPAAVRFLSCEPLLGPIDISGYLGPMAVSHLGHNLTVPGIDWVIAGGESGTKARLMHPNWARSLRNQCQAAGVPFLFKQWGEYLVSMKCADRTLDGRTWDEFPA